MAQEQIMEAGQRDVKVFHRCAGKCMYQLAEGTRGLLGLISGGGGQYGGAAGHILEYAPCVPIAIPVE